jgi:hypothetical protein
LCSRKQEKFIVYQFLEGLCMFVCMYVFQQKCDNLIVDKLNQFHWEGRLNSNLIFTMASPITQLGLRLCTLWHAFWIRNRMPFLWCVRYRFSGFVHRMCLGFPNDYYLVNYTLGNFGFDIVRLNRVMVSMGMLSPFCPGVAINTET